MPLHVNSVTFDAGVAAASPRSGPACSVPKSHGERVRRLRQPGGRAEPDVHPRARGQVGEEPGATSTSTPTTTPTSTPRSSASSARGHLRRHHREFGIYWRTLQTPRATSSASAPPIPTPQRSRRPDPSGRSALVGWGGELLGAVLEDARVDADEHGTAAGDDGLAVGLEVDELALDVQLAAVARRRAGRGRRWGGAAASDARSGWSARR